MSDSYLESKNVIKSLSARAQEIQEDLLPTKSRKQYEEEYKRFIDWSCKENVNLSEVTDEVMLVYLNGLSQSMKPNTLWSKYSMVKSTLSLKENIDTSKFHKCIAFLKRKNVGYKPKKSNVLTSEQVTKFMMEAPNNQWLLSKVILSIGIFGACRNDDLVNLSINDIQDHERYLVVSLKDGKTYKKRNFVIDNEGCPFDACNLIRKYISLRPVHMKGDRLFVVYRNGKCAAQNVGKNTISRTPKLIAQFLNLKNPELYTGHAFRRTSATLLVEGGGDLLTLKRHGGWGSSQVAEGYIEDSLERKSKVSRTLFGSVETTKPHTVTSSQAPRDLNQIPTKEDSLNRKSKVSRTIFGSVETTKPHTVTSSYAPRDLNLTPINNMD